METIIITDEIKNLIKTYAPRQDLGGFSNLKRFDLKKESRLNFQYTGLFGEFGWYSYRYGDLQRLRNLLDSKNKNYVNTGKGDDGEDDKIIFEGQERFLDVKSSHVESIDKIERLNLVIPPRELHENQVYVAAYTVGKDRREVEQVVLAGWCLSEDVKDRWYYDRDKFAVKVKDLKPISKLKEYF